MAKSERVSQKQKRRDQRAAEQKAQRRQLVRYSIIGLLVILVLAAFGYYRSITVPQVDAPQEIMAANIDGSADASLGILAVHPVGPGIIQGLRNN